jgi:hypothetical protein
MMQMAVLFDGALPTKRSQTLLQMSSLAILSLGFLLALPLIAFGQEQTVTRQFKGKPDTNINVGLFTTIKPDCTSGPLPVVRLITPPAHGKVTVRRGRLQATNLKQCLAADLPAFVALYRSEPDYSGEDTFAIEVIATNGKKQIQQITVTLTKAGTGQGI